MIFFFSLARQSEAHGPGPGAARSAARAVSLSPVSLSEARRGLGCLWLFKLLLEWPRWRRPRHMRLQRQDPERVAERRRGQGKGVVALCRQEPPRRKLLRQARPRAPEPRNVSTLCDLLAGAHGHHTELRNGTTGELKEEEFGPLERMLFGIVAPGKMAPDKAVCTSERKRERERENK